MPFCKCKHGLWGRGASRGPQVRALVKHFLAVYYTKKFRPTIYLKQNTGVSQKWRTNGALRCRRDYRKRQKNVKKILLGLFSDLAVFESGT
jgi:hypothetical protein